MIDLRIIENFPSVHRFSGSFLFQPESVPDHSTQMALLCINFAELVEEADRKDLCYRCIIHDLEESITSDIVRPIKHYNDKLKSLIDEAGKELLKTYSDESFTNEVFNAKDKSNVNGFLVHVADRVQCYLKMGHEVEFLGNRSLKKDFEIYKKFFFTLFTEIKDHPGMSDQSKKALSNYINILTSKY